VPNYMLKKSVRDELAARGISYSQYLAEKKVGRHGQKDEDGAVGSGTEMLAPGEAKQAAKSAERQVKDAERRQKDELAPEGSEILYVGKTYWGTLFYYATPGGDVWIKKVGVIGRLSEFRVDFEQQATGATARQGRGGKQNGAVAYATVTCGSYVKAHKIETVYAGVGSHVFAQAREAVARANAKAAVAAPAESAKPAEDIPGQLVKLAELRDAGIVTAEEFEAKKAELLARM
jgi:Short C-terminal domain